MDFQFLVNVSVERESGRFASRDDIAEVIQEALDGAGLDSIDGIGANSDSNYAVTEWDVEEQVLPRKRGGK